MTICDVIDVEHSNCLSVPLCLGHQFQSPGSSLSSLKHPVQKFGGVETLTTPFPDGSV